MCVNIQDALLSCKEGITYVIKTYSLLQGLLCFLGDSQREFCARLDSPKAFCVINL